MSQQALNVAGLTVRSVRGPVVEGINLELSRGETVALVGESGSGKSMTAKALTGLLPVGMTAFGTLSISGQSIPLDGNDRAWRSIRGTRIALVPQDPFTSLSPRHRCGAQIAMPLSHLPRAERDTAVSAILDEVGLHERVANQFPFQLSGGMRQRVAIAAALVTKPEVMIADEATTALDVTTQAEILELLKRLQAQHETSLLLITHDLGVAASVADRVIVLYAGRVAESGICTEVLHDPAHPYTDRLLACNPPLELRLTRLPSIPGSVPRLADVGEACTFVARCKLATDACRGQVPELTEVKPGRLAACLRVAEFRSTRAQIPGLQARVLGPDENSASGTQADPESIVSVRDLVKTFGQHRALDRIDLDVRPGESVAVVGESGSGKTTLARILVGLESADSGSVHFRSGAVAGRQARARLAQIVFQDPYSALNPSQSVGSSLRDALRAGHRDFSEVPSLLDMVGLPAGYERKRPNLLSGGERQRVAIARALAVRPELLVCDEAVSSLDVSVQAQILNLIADLRERLGLSVLFISHDLAVVRQVADRVYVLYQGRLVEHGDASDVLDHPDHDYTRQLISSVPAINV